MVTQYLVEYRPYSPYDWRMSEIFGARRRRPLDRLDQRIACALQVDGRASWRFIAEVLGESERTVTRRGTKLVADRAVAIAARPRARSNTIVGAHCELGQSRIVARAFAQRGDSFLVHILTGTPECVVLLDCPRERLGELVFEELPGVRGLINTFTQPVLRQTHTISRWRPDVLNDDEVRALVGDRRDESDGDGPAATTRDKADDLLLQALGADGRRSVDELSRLTGLSDTTVRRRVERMRRDGDLVIRAIVEPALLGLPVEAVVWVTAKPTEVESVARELGRSPFARYVSVVVGDRQIIAIVAMPSEAVLYEFVTRSSWLGNVHSVDTAIILETYKRGGALTVTGN